MRSAFCRDRVARTALAAALAGAVVPASAEVISLPAAKDNTLYEDPDGLISSGAGAHLFVGMTANGLARRGLIAFDVAGAIPAGSTITSARLSLCMSRTNTSSEPVSLHRALAEWGEGISVPIGQGGAGAPATPGDATWLHAFYPGTLWSSPGGDFALTPSATSVVAGVGMYSWSSPELLHDVQAWLDAPGTNHGWLLRGEESVAQTAKRFETREIGNPALRPALLIEYRIVPAPGGALLAVFVATARTAVRKRRDH
jgi:hypothetical protein